MRVRSERPGDAAGIRDVNLAAFEGPAEADLVDTLRANCDELLSLVAVAGGEIIGHALFSPVVICGPGRTWHGMGLGPVAVMPGHQGRGVGSALIEAGIAELRRSGCPFAIVLGHAGYYPRFGFEPAGRYGIRSEWEVPQDAFMVLELADGALADVKGVARYRPEFASAM